MTMKAKWKKLAFLAAAALSPAEMLVAQQPAQPIPTRAVAAEAFLPPLAAGPSSVQPAVGYDGSRRVAATGGSQPIPAPGGSGSLPPARPVPSAQLPVPPGFEVPALAPGDQGGIQPVDYHGMEGASNDTLIDRFLGGGGYELGWYGGFEYLFTWQKGASLPALVTTSTAPDLPVLPGSQLLYGDQQIGNRLLSGGRITVGKWLDSQDTLGVVVRMLAVEGDRSGYSTDSNANPVIGRPFYNTDPLVNAPDAFLASYPNLTTGNLRVSTNNDLFAGDLLFRVHIDGDSCSRTDLIGGYTYTQLDNGLSIRSVSQGTGTVIPIDSQIIVQDNFSTRNEFNGGTIGLWHERSRGYWTVSTLGKISFGETYQSITINGTNQAIDPAGGSTLTPGGLLAQTSNIGFHNRHKTTYVPEVAFNLTRRITDRLDFTVGYTFIYWSSMLLAADHLDNQVNGTQFQGGQLVGPANPAFPGFRDTEYWLHAMSMGINFRF
ncbi:MAG: BBP7 family outer membrane beta-barrel protein [Planctomycetota bacterium]